MLTTVGLALMLASTPPTIAPFAHGRKAAFSLEFDDSMDSQVKNALPLLAQFRIPATFYINPGGKSYRAEIWEKAVPAAGHELGNHTMHHGDTVGAAQGAQEIGDAAKIIERGLGRPTLTPFAIPGGVKWEIPEEDFRRILKENRLIFPGRKDFSMDSEGGDILRYPRAALEKGAWGQLGFHGVGGEWLSTSVDRFAALLQYLDAHRNEMWIAPTGTVWKYQREREAVRSVDFQPAGDGSYRLTLRFDRAQLEPFDLYNVPLTVQLPTPTGWERAWIVIDGRATQFRSHDGMLQFEVPPSAKSVVLKGVG